MDFSWLTPALRKRVYEIALALLVLASVYGFVNAEQATAWQSLISVLIVGMARANVSPE